MYTQRQTESAPPLAIMHGGRVMYFRQSCAPCVQKRLGVGTAAGEAVGKGISSVAAFTGPAAPIVAAVGELVSVISSFFGGGCGSACTQSATLEQVPEVALDDLWAVAQAGMLGQADFLSAYQTIDNYATQSLQNLEKTDSKAAGGLTNYQKATANYQSLAASLPATAPNGLNLSQAQELFTNPSAAGWEPGSVSAGNNLALQVLQSIGSGSSSATGTVSALASAVGLSEESLLLIGGAILLWAFL